MYDIIKSIWQDSRKTYGAVRIHKNFRNYNKSDDIKEAARNILKRNFDTEKSNEKWVSDITYIWTRKDGWCYLSSIMDLHSRRIISHKVGKFMEYKIPLPPLPVQEYIVSKLDKFDKIINDIKQGLPKEIELRQKQYEYYREKLLNFEK